MQSLAMRAPWQRAAAAMWSHRVAVRALSTTPTCCAEDGDKRKRNSWAQPSSTTKVVIQTPEDHFRRTIDKLRIERLARKARKNTTLEFMSSKMKFKKDFTLAGIAARHEEELSRILDSDYPIDEIHSSSVLRELTEELRVIREKNMPFADSDSDLYAARGSLLGDLMTEQQPASIDLDGLNDSEVLNDVPLLGFGMDDEDADGDVDGDDPEAEELQEEDRGGKKGGKKKGAKKGGDDEGDDEEEEDGDDDDEDIETFEEKHLSNYAYEILQVRRVVCMKKGGKERSLSVLAVAGNENGAVGFGTGKATEASKAAREASVRATRSLVPLKLFEGRTIYNPVRVKVGAVHMEMRPAAAGKGLICHHVLQKIFTCAGIKDISVNLRGSMNPANIARAAMLCFERQLTFEDVARRLGQNALIMRRVRRDMGQKHPHFG